MRRDHMMYNNEGWEAVNVATNGKHISCTDEEMPSKRYKSMIETNERFGAGRVEPEKEKNPQQEMKLV